MQRVSVQCKSTAARVQSREYRECKGTESRGGSTVHDESTVREYRVRVQRREYRECESAEIVRAQSREYRECKGTESRGLGGSTVHNESTV